MVIQHNIPALNAHRNLMYNNSLTAKNLEKLSSGYRINRAADDAAGLAISEKMRGQIRGLGMAEQNTKHGINLIQTAEGALNETHSIIQRMRELAVQASNGTYQDEDRELITKEFEALKSEVNRIAESTHYNNIKLLDGSLGVGSSGGGANKLGDLAGVFKFTESVPVAAVKAEYQIDAANGKAFFEALARDQGLLSFSAGATNAGELLSLMGLSSKDYDVLNVAGTAAFGADISAGAIIRAKVAGVDANAQDIVSKGQGIVNGSANAGFFEKVVGADKYRDTVLTFDRDALSDLSLIGKTFTINGKTYEFAGQNDKDENDALLTIATTTANGSTLQPGGVKLNNGNTAIWIGDIAAPTTSSEVEAFVGKVIQRIADTINAAETPVGQTIVAAFNGIGQTAVGTPGTTAATATDINGAKVGWVGTDVLGYKIRLFSTNIEGLTGGGKSSGSGQLVFQIGANGGQDQRVSLSVEDMSAKGIGIDKTSIDTQDKANDAIVKLEASIITVAGQRASLGALQNRLESTLNSLGVAKENLTAAESTIRDVDMAKEMMEFTKNNILVQAAQAMLAQANQLPQGVLQLLR